MKINPKLSPEQLRERAERYVMKARQNVEKAEAYFRVARRRESAIDDKLTKNWPWPCQNCAAQYATEEELSAHKAGLLAPVCVVDRS